MLRMKGGEGRREERREKRISLIPLILELRAIPRLSLPVFEEHFEVVESEIALSSD